MAGTTAARCDKGVRRTVLIYGSRADHSPRPICLSSIIESNGVGDSTRPNKIFHICAIVNLPCHNNEICCSISRVTVYKLKSFSEYCLTSLSLGSRALLYLIKNSCNRNNNKNLIIHELLQNSYLIIIKIVNSQDQNQK